MDDFDEADEQNEEDLMLLGDKFAQIKDLKEHIIQGFKGLLTDPKQSQGREYLEYCINQLHDDDKQLAKIYLQP